MAELTHGIQRAKMPEHRQRQQAFIDELIAVVPVHALTLEMARTAGILSGQAAEQGVTLPFADLLIGATALEPGFAIVTVNVRDFDRIPGLVVKQQDSGKGD